MTKKTAKKFKPENKRAPSERDKEIAAQVRIAREAVGMTQDDLAEALGVGKTQVQKYEHGISRISAGRLEEIANVLKHPVAFFYKRTKP